MLGRLTKTEDFERVRSEGARWRGRYCVLNAAPRTLAEGVAGDAVGGDAGEPGQPSTRVGYITSKSLGSAAKRNRARRLLREAVRHSSDSIVPGWDIVLIAQASIIADKARMQQVQEDLLWLLNQARLMRPMRIAK